LVVVESKREHEYKQQRNQYWKVRCSNEMENKRRYSKREEKAAALVVTGQNTLQ